MHIAEHCPPAHRSTHQALLVLLALLVSLAWTLPARASDRDDHEKARQALQAGQILPLGSVLERLARDQPGQVLEVELEHDHGTWLYEVKLLQTGGRVLKFKVDAASGVVLSQKAKTHKQP